MLRFLVFFATAGEFFFGSVSSLLGKEEMNKDTTQAYTRLAPTEIKFQ